MRNFFVPKAHAAMRNWGFLGCMICWDDIHVRQLLDFVRDLALLQITQVHHINDVLPEIVLAGVGR